MTEDLDLSRYDQLASRVYGEQRMPSGTRDLALALGWVTLRDPHRHHPNFSVWPWARDVLHVSNKRMWQLIANDAPRYEYDWKKAPSGCQAPMDRADRLCGKSVTFGFPELDLTTGWLIYWGVCSRPVCREYIKPVYKRARKSQEKEPEAIPNTGGLLPVFFQWNWEEKYRKASKLIRSISDWEPPSYGLSADEWPEVPDQEKPKTFPKLRLVASNGEILPGYN